MTGSQAGPRTFSFRPTDMAKRSFWTIIGLVYDNVHAALWTALCLSLLYFAFVVAPALTAAHERLRRQRLREIGEESKTYCEKWGMVAGTARHLQCTLDLQIIRARVEQRLAEDSWF